MSQRAKGKHTAVGFVFWGLLAALTLLRLALAGCMMIYFTPDSGYDDLLQISKAMSISGGQWLGEYGSMTLVKGAGYPLLTAALHTLGLPYILGYHLLYAGGCVLFCAALRPLVKNRWVMGGIYLFMLYCPIAFSAQLTRLYRDVGYYAVAFYCVAALLGFLLRYSQKGGGLAFAAAGGVMLAFAHNYREDAHWLYIYAAACLVAWVVLRLVAPKGSREKRRRLLLAPVLLLAGWAAVMLPVAAVNQATYGTFTIDEYNSGPYARAYGALKRIDGGLQDPHIVIPEEKRLELYALSPAFAELYEVLDAPGAKYAQWKEEQGEYRAGYFSFVLRDAAAAVGYYKSAETANAYFTRLASEVNGLCDAGLIEAGPPATGITARFYPWMVGPVFSASFEGMWQVLACGGIDPRPLPIQADDAYLDKFESYVHGTIAADRDMPDGSTVQNYVLEGPALWGQRLMRAIVAAYRVLMPVLFILALAAVVALAVLVPLKRKGCLAFYGQLVAVASLLCLFALRCGMIGFVHVSSFSAIYTPAYQAAGYPVALGFVAAAAAFVLHWAPRLLPAKPAALAVGGE